MNTLYWVVTTSSVAPSKTQIVAGKDHGGMPATASGNQAVVADGVQNIVVTGLATSETYTAHFFRRDFGFDSNIVSTSSFTVPFAGSLDFSVAINSMYLGGPS